MECSACLRMRTSPSLACFASHMTVSLPKHEHTLNLTLDMSAFLRASLLLHPPVRDPRLI